VAVIVCSLVLQCLLCCCTRIVRLKPVAALQHCGARDVTSSRLAAVPQPSHGSAHPIHCTHLEQLSVARAHLASSSIPHQPFCRRRCLPTSILIDNHDALTLLHINSHGLTRTTTRSGNLKTVAITTGTARLSPLIRSRCQPVLSHLDCRHY